MVQTASAALQTAPFSTPQTPFCDAANAICDTANAVCDNTNTVCDVAVEFYSMYLFRYVFGPVVSANFLFIFVGYIYNYITKSAYIR